MESSTTSASTIVWHLRRAQRDLRARGLKQASRFAVELLLGMPDDIRRSQPRTRRDANMQDDAEDGEIAEDLDRCEASVASMDAGEFLCAHHMLESHKATEGKLARFLRLYSLYLAGEKVKDEADLEISVAGTRKDVEQAQATRVATNPRLKELYLSLANAYADKQLDAFGGYLFAVVLSRLGYASTAGTVSDRMDQLDLKADQTTTTAVTPRQLLIDSIAQYPWNWSAWMELASLSPFISEEEASVLTSACPWMFQLFLAHILLEQQQYDAATDVLGKLAVIFPQSTHLMAQHALVSYHMRDFDFAQEQFAALATRDPHRLETMDVYSNVLYVKEDKTELSRLAHRALQVEKYRPETCCIIGNYYSLKNKHDRAIVYFNRALRLDPSFLSAWTLIGHEYVEMKNTSAAIEAYRRAVTLSNRDYRAWYGLGQAYEILHMYLYSIYNYKKATSIRPHDARMWCALGGCYEKLGKIDDAIACFGRAISSTDREGIASYHLGGIFAKRGHRNAAAAYYQLHLGLRTASDVTRMALSEHTEVSLPQGGAQVRVDTPQALAAVRYLANYYKTIGQYADAVVMCNRLLDLQGPEKEEAKALLREMRSLEAARTLAAAHTSVPTSMADD